MTPDLLIRRYCECARSVWNTYFLGDAVDEFTVKRFDEIRRLLFHSLVLVPLERDDDRNEDEEPWDFLQVIPASGPLTVLVEEPSKDGNRYWNAAPRDLDYSSALLQFVDLFDWDVQGFRDMSLVMVWMPQGPAGAGLDSRYALFERQSVTELRPQAAHVDIHGARAAVITVAPDPSQQVITREHLAAALAQVDEQRELLGRQRDGLTALGDLVRSLIHHDRPDLVPLFGGKFAAAPLDGADARVQLFGHVRMQHEVVEAARRIDASHLADGHGNQRADVVERLLLAHCPERSDREIWAIERLKHQGTRPALHVRIVLEKIHRIIPEVERPDARSELAQRCARAVFAIQHGAMTHDGNKRDFFGAWVSQCLFHQR